MNKSQSTDHHPTHTIPKAQGTPTTVFSPEVTQTLNQIKHDYGKKAPSAVMALYKVISQSPDIQRSITQAVKDQSLVKFEIDLDGSTVSTGAGGHYDFNHKKIVMPLSGFNLNSRQNEIWLTYVLAHELNHAKNAKTTFATQDKILEDIVALANSDVMPRDYTPFFMQFKTLRRDDERAAEEAAINATLAYAKQQAPNLTPLEFIQTHLPNRAESYLNADGQTFKPGIEFDNNDQLVLSPKTHEAIANYYYDNPTYKFGKGELDYWHQDVAFLFNQIGAVEALKHRWNPTNDDTILTEREADDNPADPLNYGQINMQALGLTQRNVQAAGLAFDVIGTSINQPEDLRVNHFALVDSSNPVRPETMHFYPGNQAPIGALKRTQGIPGAQELDKLPSRIETVQPPQTIGQFYSRLQSGTNTNPDNNGSSVEQVRSAFAQNPVLKHAVGQSLRAGIEPSLYRKSDGSLASIASTAQAILNYEAKNIIINQQLINTSTTKAIQGLAKQSQPHDYTNIVHTHLNQMSQLETNAVFRIWNTTLNAIRQQFPGQDQAVHLATLNKVYHNDALFDATGIVRPNVQLGRGGQLLDTPTNRALLHENNFSINANKLIPNNILPVILTLETESNKLKPNHSLPRLDLQALGVDLSQLQSEVLLKTLTRLGYTDPQHPFQLIDGSIGGKLGGKVLTLHGKEAVDQATDSQTTPEVTPKVAPETTPNPTTPQDTKNDATSSSPIDANLLLSQFLASTQKDTLAHTPRVA